uniref:Uncharacterized protein n=1 Tax=Arundo donax TaxID=35708 RepID=A0A0A9HMC3_ARUDO
MTELCWNPGQDGLFLVCWTIQSYVTWLFNLLSSWGSLCIQSVQDQVAAI